MIRVLIVEDQRMAREDMENYIQSSGRYCLAASITNAAMAETVCRQSRCKLVLMDVCTENDESGLVAAEKIKKTMDALDFMNDPDALDKMEELKAMDISCDAVIILGERYHELALELAEKL